MADLIDRQAAIEAITIYRNESVMPKMWYDGMSVAINCIHHLPSAEAYNSSEWCTDCKEYDHERKCCPRFNQVIRTALGGRKKGEWEVIDEVSPRRYGCSLCKRLSWYEYNFCPNCGAEMRGEGDG